MRTERRIQLLAGLVLVACLAASGVLTAAASALAGRAQLTYADRAEEGDPPEVAVGIALGAFRGLFTNVLWLRATELKEQGKFHESIELARTITRLQPRFPRVWAFHAWNMAYNISVATNSQSERWQWVQAGIEILRDEGIPKNPNEMLLHKELAWIFIHKIQGFSDDAHHYYKQQLAREWQILLGPPPPRGDTREESTSRAAERLQRILDAPPTLEALADDHPRFEEVRAMLDEADLPIDRDLLRLNELYRAVLTAYVRENVSLGMPDDPKIQSFVELAGKLRAEQELAAAFSALLDHLRKRALIDAYNMEPARMLRYTRLYGPLDWRHPATHALYWTTRGVEEGLERVNVEDFDQTNTDRVVLHALQELFRWGNIYYDMLNGTYVQMLDLEFAETYGRILEEELAERATFFESFDTNRPFRLYAAGYENFMRDLTRVHYRMGYTEKAQKTYSRLRNWEHLNTGTPTTTKAELSLPLDEFIQQDLKERISSPEFAQSEIVATLNNAFNHGLLYGNIEVFVRSMRYARRVHKGYMSEQNFQTPVATRFRMQRIEPRFVDTAANGFITWLINANLGQWQARRVWRQLINSDLRTVAQAAYDEMKSVFANRYADFNEVFPEPPGMDEYRAARARIEAQDREKKVEDIQTEQR